jgi:hypothetical protein
MKYMSKNSYRQISGQIGIIVILITVAILTFSLSVANRVIEESKVTVDRSDSIRVFNIAETGIDEALNQIYQYENESGGTLTPGVVFQDSTNQVSIAVSQTFDGYLGLGESLRIDLSGNAGNIEIDWSKNACDVSNKVALLLTYLHLDANDEYQSLYYLVGNDDCIHKSAQNFLAADPSSLPEYIYHYTLGVGNSNDATLYIQTIGSGTDIQVSANPGLISSAQYEIESLAKSEDEVSNKAIEVNKSLPAAPGFMSFALFSGGTIAK